MKSLDILSYNIQLGRRFDDVVAWIRREQLTPDIFCFQEFPEEKLPPFEEFLREQGYAYVYTPGIVLRGVQLGELTAHKMDSLQLVNREDISLGNHFLERRHKAVSGERSALITTYKVGQKMFSVANIHLSVLSPHSMRYKQLAVVMNALEDAGTPSVIIGDFNYTSLLGVKRLFAFMKSFGYTCVGKRLITHRLLRHIPQQLDYAFHKGIEPLAISVMKARHSDHLPLYVKLAISRP